MRRISVLKSRRWRDGGGLHERMMEPLGVTANRSLDSKGNSSLAPLALAPLALSNPGTPAYQAWAQKLTIMEHFNGRTYQQVPDGTDPVTITLWHSPRDLLQLRYEALKTSVYQTLALQTRLKPYLDEIGLSITDAGIRLDFTQVKADLNARMEADRVSAIADLMDFNASTREMLAGSGWNDVDVVMDYLGTHPMTAELQGAPVCDGKSRRWRYGHIACPNRSIQVATAAANGKVFRERQLS